MKKNRGMLTKIIHQNLLFDDMRYAAHLIFNHMPAVMKTFGCFEPEASPAGARSRAVRRC